MTDTYFKTVLMFSGRVCIQHGLHRAQPAMYSGCSRGCAEEQGPAVNHVLGATGRKLPEFSQ